MQIKTLLHSKGFALSPVLKVRVSGTRKWPIHRAKKSVGPVCLTRALNIHIRIRQSTHSNRTIGKIIRFVKELSLAIRTSKKNPCLTFAIFAIFGDISGPFLASFLSKSGILLDLLFLGYLSRVFSASMKNPCYFCDFCDICGHFGALLGFFFFSKS